MTRNRTFRVSDGLWAATTAAAATRGDSVSAVLRAALERYANSVPTSETTPHRRRSVRVPDATWEAAQRVADAAHETVSDGIRRELETYATDNVSWSKPPGNRVPPH